MDGGFSASKQDNHYNAGFHQQKLDPDATHKPQRRTMPLIRLKKSLSSLKNSVQKCRKLSHRSIILRKELVPLQENARQMGTDREQAKTWSDRRTSSLPGQEQGI